MKIIDLARTAYWWLPGLDSIADVTAPKLTELSAGTDPDGSGPGVAPPGAINISPFVINSTEITSAASDTTNERSVVATGNASTPTIGNYSGQLNLFRDALDVIPANATSIWSDDDLASLFPRKGVEGYIIKRTGLPWRDALKVGQEVEVYGFVTDTPMKPGGKQDGYLKLMVPLLPTGDFEVTAEIA